MELVDGLFSLSEGKIRCWRRPLRIGLTDLKNILVRQAMH
jgi:hypothetical protein